MPRLRSGDEGAWRTLYDRHAGQIAGYARSRGVRDVDDLVGDVYTSAAERIAHFAGDDAALRSWLFTIAHHRIADAHRRRVRRRTEPVDPAAPALIEVDADRTAEITSRLDAAGAMALLDTLTDDQRDVIVLRVLGQLSIAETAEVVGKPEGAVKALQHRAIARLQRALAGGPYPNGSSDDHRGGS